jgi:membrane protein DedA with SNARE-associated domain
MRKYLNLNRKGNLVALILGCVVWGIYLSFLGLQLFKIIPSFDEARAGLGALMFFSVMLVSIGVFTLLSTGDGENAKVPISKERQLEVKANDAELVKASKTVYIILSIGLCLLVGLAAYIGIHIRDEGAGIMLGIIGMAALIILSLIIFLWHTVRRIKKEV